MQKFLKNLFTAQRCRRAMFFLLFAAVMLLNSSPELRADALRLEALIKRLRRAQKLALIAAPETVFTVFGEKLKGAEFLPLPPERLTL